MTAITSSLANGSAIEMPPSAAKVHNMESGQHQQPKVDPETVSHQFVNEYYTFMNKDPAKLHCFYNKKSHMTHGVEGRPVATCVGQKEIHDLIASLQYENCRLLINNVDYQPSANGSVFISVMGSLSNNNRPARRFVQSFLLAEQPNGYYILNDIFRYFKDEQADVVDIVAASEPVVEVAEPIHHAVVPKNVAKTVASPAAVDSAIISSSVSTPAPVVEKKVAAQAVPETVAASSDDVHVAPVASAIIVSGEKPTEVPAAAESAAAKKESKSWATLAASDHNKWGNQVSNANKGTVTTVTTANDSKAASSVTNAKTENSAAKSSRRGGDSGNKQRKDNDQQHLFMIYIKGVPEEVSSKDLTDYFNQTIGNVRSSETVPTKNYGVVEFKTVEDAKKAVGVKFVIKGKEFVAEERRPRQSFGSGGGGNGNNRHKSGGGGNKESNGNASNGNARRDRRHNRNNSAKNSSPTETQQ